MSQAMDARYEISVSGTNQSIAWVHACLDLEKNGGGTILSRPPIEQRGIEPVTAAFLIVVYFTGRAIGAAVEEFGKEIGGAIGREVVERYIAKLQENGAEVEVSVEEVEPPAAIPELPIELQRITQQLRDQQDEKAAMSMLAELMAGRSEEERRDIALRTLGRVRALHETSELRLSITELVQHVGVVISDY